MSTTFAVILKDGEMRDIARRVGRGVLGAELRFTDPMAELLSDAMEVVPTDNSAQGIYTIGDIRAHIKKQEEAENFVREPEEAENQSWIKDPSKIERYERKSVSVPLDSAWHKSGDFLEVSEWHNGEGWDIAISTHTEKSFSLHFSEYEVMKELIGLLEKD